MQILTSLRVLGFILIAFSLTHLLVIGVALWYQEPEVITFLFAGIVTFLVGFCLSYFVRHSNQELRIRDGFFIVTLVWIVVCLFGALPFMFSPSLAISFTDAMFESVSGLTTTGSTVIVGLDYLPRAILYYRQQLHLLGGMGIIVLAVAVMPLLGIGGLQLFRAETSNLANDNKLTPRITQTAKALWFIYLGLTVACALSYWAGGMSLFDAICFSYGTVSTGGFTPYDASFVYPQISLRLIAVVFMLLGVINFSLHFLCLRHKTLSYYWKDDEVKTFLLIQLVIVALCVLVMFRRTTLSDPGYSFVEILFQVVSISTTTGFTVTSFHMWPLFLPFLLILAPVIGGCSGSTSGGIKVVRMLLLLKQGLREIKRMVHPKGYFLLKINQQIVSTRVSDAVWGFVGMYFVICLVLFLLTLSMGLDFITSWSGLLASITNMGPGLGEVAFHYRDVTDGAKWIFSFAMLLGRLELFTILVLFTPAFWRN